LRLPISERAQARNAAMAAFAEGQGTLAQFEHMATSS
jgi:hypothetical protein